MRMVPGKITLETGEFFFGQIPATQTNKCFGEIVFSTGMVGYVESLTDPSYAGQILAFTYPAVGNYGVPDPSEWESTKIHAKGVVMCEMAATYSNHTAVSSLADWLASQDIPYITGVDTRALTICLRSQGVIPGAITMADDQPDAFERFDDIHWVSKVSTPVTEIYGSGDKTVIVVDCGIKENILRSLQEFPVRIKRVPYNYDYSDDAFDGIFLSNGPGDPKHCTETIQILQKALKKQKPVFGICLGTQLLAMAVGAKTYKLPFGHRAHNQPCMNMANEKCYLTSQNHSYAVDEKTLPQDWRVTFRNLNDQSVEGIEHHSLPYFAVQFHPEAAPGPCDTQWLFEKFYQSL